MSEYLLHPELFSGAYVVGEKVADELYGQAMHAESQVQSSPEEPITVAVRTLNEADKLERLLDGVNSQKHIGETQIVVIDNESSDGTRDVAKLYGADVVTLPRGEFSYSRSMNMAMEAADNPLVFMTVGHAALSTTVSLAAGIEQFRTDETLGGAFGVALPDVVTSRTEKLANIALPALIKPGYEKKAKLGVLAATGAIFHKGIWEELGKFDEAFQRGGEDTQLAGKMLEAGYSVFREPLLSTHHAHGLGPINYAKQMNSWRQMASGKDTRPLNIDDLASRRPDLDFS